jgi:hypothetical protein
LKRTICGFAAVVLSLLAYITAASAQSGSAYFAGGTAIDSSAGPINTLGAGTLYESPRMGGFFETIGGDYKLFHNVGVGAEMSFRSDRGAYAGLEYHPTFYDINAVYQPLTIARRLSPEIQGGFGKASLNLYYTQQMCYKLSQGCPGVNAEASSATDLQVHFALGLRFYAYKGLFVRPQVDIRRVQSNFSSYFGSPWVSQYSVAVGYTVQRNRRRTAQK